MSSAAGSALWPASRRPKQSVPLIILEGEAESCFHDTFDLIKPVLLLLRVQKPEVSSGEKDKMIVASLRDLRVRLFRDKTA